MKKKIWQAGPAGAAAGAVMNVGEVGARTNPYRGKSSIQMDNKQQGACYV